ncbi:MAG: hypothetical protein IPP71_13605 [Bacteroidetes bacterium]|nr:hypothetical protein [Bacteroidota bacterium]
MKKTIKLFHDLIINTVSTGDTLSSSDSTLLESIFEQDCGQQEKVFIKPPEFWAKNIPHQLTQEFMEQLQQIKRFSCEIYI